MKVSLRIALIEGRTEFYYELIARRPLVDELKDVLFEVQSPGLFLQVQANLPENQIRPWQ